MQKNSNSGKFRIGFILSMLNAFFCYIGRLIHNSFFVSLLTDYKKIEDCCIKSKSSSFISKLSNAKHKTLGFKNKCARFAEDSILMNAIDYAGKSFFNTNLRSVGIFLLSAGGLISSANLAEHTESIASLRFSDTFIFGIMMILSSLFMLPQKNKSISGCIRDSRFLSYFFVNTFYVKHLDESEKNQPVSFYAIAFIFGITFGAFSYAVSPVPALFVLLYLAYLYLIFTKPENGILLICLQLPMLSDSLLMFLIAASGLSLVFKIIRGKRPLGLNICSSVIIIIGIILLSCCVFSFDSTNAFNDILPFAAAIILCIIVIMNVRSSTFAGKCFNMLGLSVIISLLLGLNRTITSIITGYEGIETFIEAVHFGFNATLSTSESCAAFLTALIPLFIVRQQKNSRIFAFPFLCLAVVCLILCNQYYAVLSLYIAIVISMIIFSKFGIWTAIAAVFAGFALPRVLNAIPGLSILASDIYANSAFKSNYQLASFFTEYGITGAGMGSEAVAYAALEQGINASHIDGVFGVYTDLAMKLGIPLMLICLILLLIFVSKTVSYAVSKHKSEDAKSKCVALFTSITAIGIYALFSDFLYDFKILALMFLILGLSSAVADSAEADYISPERYPEHEIL